MNNRQLEDSQIEITDLPSRDVDAGDAAQVKGGFNPQPDPPKVMPIFLPPVFRPPVFTPLARA
ncbi:MAG TPA: hypothetical protein VGM82_23635 [Gemmatimonadaceae bacterium]|jgi:hypothetical protein